MNKSFEKIELIDDFKDYQIDWLRDHCEIMKPPIYVLFGKKGIKEWPIVASFFKDKLEDISKNIQKEYPTNAEEYYIVTLGVIVVKI